MHLKHLIQRLSRELKWHGNMHTYGGRMFQSTDISVSETFRPPYAYLPAPTVLTGAVEFGSYRAEAL